MADDGEVPVEGGEAAPVVVPDHWKAIDSEKIGRAIRLMDAADPEALPALISGRHPVTQKSLLQVAVEIGYDSLLEYLIKKGKRAALAIQDTKSIDIFDKIQELRNRPPAEEEPAPEPAEGEEPPPPKKDPIDALAEEIGANVYKTREIAALGFYEGGRDPETKTRSGFGTSVFLNNDFYLGSYAEGQRSGRGLYVYAKGGLYYGDFANNQKSGHGRAVYTNGVRYNGEWAADAPNGQGKITYPNGEVYEGSFKDGQKSGTGVYTFADGSKYTGEWANGSFLSGKWTTATNLTYSGSFHPGNVPRGNGQWECAGLDVIQHGQYIKKHWRPSSYETKVLSA